MSRKPEWGRRRVDNQPYPKTRGREELPKGLISIGSKSDDLIELAGIMKTEFGCGIDHIMVSSGKDSHHLGIKIKLSDIKHLVRDGYLKKVKAINPLPKDEWEEYGFSLPYEEQYDYVLTEKGERGYARITAFERGESEGLWQVIYVPFIREHPDPSKKYGARGTLVERFKTYEEAHDFVHEQRPEVREKLHLVKPIWVKR